MRYTRSNANHVCVNNVECAIMCVLRVKMQKWATEENVQMISDMNCISEFESCQIQKSRLFYLKMCHSIDDVDTLQMTTIDVIIILK